jgi:hypothetical protein
MVEVLLTLLAAPVVTRSEVLAQEIGHTVAHATLVMDRPEGFRDLADGRRVFYWHKRALGSEDGPRCRYTAYATNDGMPNALAAWIVVATEASAPGC